jgi:hypothetical protein
MTNPEMLTGSAGKRTMKQLSGLEMPEEQKKTKLP